MGIGNNFSNNRYLEAFQKKTLDKKEENKKESKTDLSKSASMLKSEDLTEKSNSFEKALYTPKYLRDDSIVINGETVNKSNNKLILLDKTYNKVWSKIISFLDTRSIGDNVKDNKYPTRNSYEDTLKALKDEEIQNEIVKEVKNEVLNEVAVENKKQSVFDLLN